MEVDVVRFAALLGRINPRAWDAIIPHGPLDGLAAAQAVRAALQGFDPQPDPPGRWRRLLHASAEVAHEIAMTAIAAEASGSGSAASIVARAVDDWCGSKPNDLPIPWPRSWPFPWPVDYPGPDTFPGPDHLYPGPDHVKNGDETFSASWTVQATRMVGGLSLASIASRLSEGEVRNAILQGAERLVQTATSV